MGEHTCGKQQVAPSPPLPECPKVPAELQDHLDDHDYEGLLPWEYQDDWGLPDPFDFGFDLG